MDKHILELFWEVPVIFLTLLLLTRVQGKKQISHLTYFDYITGITIGDVAAGVISDQDIGITRTLVALVLLTGLSVIASYLAERSRWVRKVTEGEPIIVLKDGKILEKNLRSQRVDIDHLTMLLRKKNIFSVEEVDFAVLETDGSLSVMKKIEEETVTKKDLGIRSNVVKPSIELIIDGELDMKSLKEIGKDKDWVLEVIQENGFEEIKDVSYMEFYKNGEIYIDSYDDNLRSGD